MAFLTTCPRCLTSYRLPERQAGKRVRCKHCTATFLAETHAPATMKDESVPFVEEVADGFKETTKRPPHEHFHQEDRDRRLLLARDGPDSANGPEGGEGLVIGFVVSVLVLLTLAGGMAWFFTTSSATPESSPAAVAAIEPVSRNRDPPLVEDGAPPKLPARPIESVVGPKDVASALVLLQGNEEGGKKAALDWLKVAPVEEGRRDAVAKALNDALEDAGLRQDALTAIARWGGKANTEKLVALLDEPAGSQWTSIVAILAKMEDDGAVEAVSRQLLAPSRRTQVTEALREAWPRMGEKHVVKYLHHPHEQVREEATRLLTHYATEKSVLIEQSRQDLEAKDDLTRRSACMWLAKQRPTDDQQDTVAKALGERLEDADDLVKVAALAALDRWATKDTVKAVCGSLQHAPLQQMALKVLARLKRDESIEPLVEYLVSPNMQDVAKVLISFGNKAEKPTWRQLENKVPNVRLMACVILSEVGGRESVEKLNTFAKAYPAQKKVAQAAIKKIQERMR